ncbi:MAG: c-type heme family protein [Deltaproteobacteria bacterium]
MRGKSFTVIALLLIAAIVYLFAEAPAPLPDGEAVGEKIPIEMVFAIAQAQNAAVRALWTKEIVGEGQKAGFKFNEDWREAGVEAGPLPALFLRATAASLEKNPVRLSLFLGSDFPINQSNAFTGSQLKPFEGIRKDGTPQFFYSEDTRLYTGMFSDLAQVEPCVTCHNEHKDSPKKDWKIGDVMGATTWLYPKAMVSSDELLVILAAIEAGFREAYSEYLEKAKTFSAPPEIGNKWPRDGYFLPSADAFIQEARARYSPGTLASLLKSALIPSENGK